MKVKIVKPPRKLIITKASNVRIKPGDKGKIINMTEADYKEIENIAEVIKEPKKEKPNSVSKFQK